MAMPQITGVHVDNISHDSQKASAGFTLGEHRYHLWFNPKTMQSDGVLYKNAIKAQEPHERRSPTQKLNPEAATNRPLIAEMWRQIKDGNMIAEAIRLESYEAVRNDAENENHRFDLRIKFRARAALCLPGGALPNDAENKATIAKIIDAMEWAQNQ